jgi:hypothetical protein
LWNTKIVSENTQQTDSIPQGESFETQKVVSDNTQQTDSISKGDSFETAIKVNSIDKEYEYIRQVCPSCMPKGQALIFHNEKPYDIITVINKDGVKTNYYFDISSFFGRK